MAYNSAKTKVMNKLGVLRLLIEAIERIICSIAS
jgi:F420-dependent methylenetetrahydromethanopterin dehydrogenase